MIDDILQNRLEELALRCAHSGRTQFTRFTDPAILENARAAAGHCGVKLAHWGGYEGAERCIAAFYDQEPPTAEEYPVKMLRIQWNSRFANPGHRDLLGALMNIGIDRETFGDIVMGTWKGDACAYLFVLSDMTGFIPANLERAGKASLKVFLQQEPPELLPPEGEAMRLTVQQARLDAVVAAVFRLSRSEGQRLIAAGQVKLNHIPCLRPDVRVAEGDILSVRGHGRVTVSDFQGQSRRGRQVITVFRYK